MFETSIPEAIGFTAIEPRASFDVAVLAAELSVFSLSAVFDVLVLVDLIASFTFDSTVLVVIFFLS